MAEVGRYRIVERLRQGGMAIVDRAVLEGPAGFSKHVAVKRIRPDLAEQREVVEMFLREARLSALLDHRAIVKIFELGVAAGEYFLAMEFIDGLDLATLLFEAPRRPLSIGAAVHVADELAGALDHAHGAKDQAGRPRKIIHRDVSPTNVMVAWSGEVKLVDFGIARAAAEVSDERTRTGLRRGKIGYFSPEQLEGGELDERSDLFALGIVAHECLTGRRLFRGLDDGETIDQIRRAAAEPPSQIRPEIPQALDELVMWLLALRPEARPPSALALREALEPLVRELGAERACVRRAMDEARSRPPLAPRARVEPPFVRRTRGVEAARRPSVAISCALLVGLVGAGAMAVYAGRARPVASLPTIDARRSSPKPALTAGAPPEVARPAPSPHLVSALAPVRKPTAPRQPAGPPSSKSTRRAAPPSASRPLPEIRSPYDP